MAYYVHLPNGEKMLFEDSVPQDQARYQAMLSYYTPKEQPAAPPPHTPGAEGSSWFPVAASLYRTGAELASAGEGLGRATGLRGLEEYARGRQGAAEHAAAEALPPEKQVKFEELGGDLSLIPKYITQQATAAAPMMVAGVTGARLGAMPGAAIGGSLAGPPGAAIGGIAGGIIGGGLAMFPSLYGGMRESQITQIQEQRKKQGLPPAKREDVEVNEAAAAGAALPVALAQSGANRLIFGLGKTLGMSTEEVGATLLPRIAKGAGLGAAEQIPVGVLQTALDRAQTGRDLLSPEAIDDYKKITAESAAIGAAFGGAHRGISGARPKPQDHDLRLLGALETDLAERRRLREAGGAPPEETPPGAGVEPPTEPLAPTGPAGVEAPKVEVPPVEPQQPIAFMNTPEGVDLLGKITEAQNAVNERRTKRNLTALDEAQQNYQEAMLRYGVEQSKAPEVKPPEVPVATEAKPPEAPRPPVTPAAPEPAWTGEAAQAGRPYEASGRASEAPKAPEAPTVEPPKAAEEPVAEPPKATPAEESAAAKARKIIDEYLDRFRSSGNQGKNIADSLSKLLDEEKINTATAYAAFRAGEVLNRQLPAGANHAIEFVNLLTTEGKSKTALEASGATGKTLAGERLAPAMGPDGVMEGVIRISLEPNKLGLMKDTAAHEGFHVIQDYLAKYDPKLKAFLDRDFRNDMTIKDIDPTLIKKLDTAQWSRGVSFWDKLSKDLGDNKLSAREAQAYTFAALSDASTRGMPMTGIKPAYTRFVNSINQFFQRLGNALRGDGFQTAGDVFERINRGEAARRFSTQESPLGAPRERPWTGEAPVRARAYNAEAEMSARGREERTEPKPVNRNSFNNSIKSAAHNIEFSARGDTITGIDLIESGGQRGEKRYNFVGDLKSGGYLNIELSVKGKSINIDSIDAIQIKNNPFKFQASGFGKYSEGVRLGVSQIMKLFDRIIPTVKKENPEVNSITGTRVSGTRMQTAIERGLDLTREQSDKLEKILSTRLNLREDTSRKLTPEEASLGKSIQEGLNGSPSTSEFSARSHDELVNFRMSDWDHVQLPEEWGIGGRGMAFYYKGSFAHGGNLDIDAYVSHSNPETLYVGTAATSGASKNPFATKSRTQMQNKDIEWHVDLGVRQALASTEKMVQDIVNMWPDIKKVEFIRGTGSRGIFAEGKEGSFAIPERWVPWRKYRESERPQREWSAEGEFSARGSEEYAARTAAPAGPGASFVEKVQGADYTRPSVFSRALAAITGAKAVTGIYGTPQAERHVDAWIRSINMAHPFYIVEDLLRSQGLWNGRSAGRALEEAFNTGGRIGYLLEHGMLEIDPITKEIRGIANSKSLFDIFGDRVSASNINEQRDFGAYLIALREKDLRANNRQGFHNVTDAEIATHIRDMEAAHPEWRNVANDLQEFNKGLLRFAKEAGVIDQAQMTHLESMFYTPFYRLMDSDVNAAPERSLGPRMTNALNDPRAWMRELKGGESAVGSVYENIIRNADSILKSGMKNMAMQQATEVMEIAGLARKVGPGISAGRNENAISFRVNGQEVQYHVNDPVLWSVIGGMPTAQRGALGRAAQWFAHTFREAVTMAPSFMLANLWRGKIVAYAQEGSPLIRGTGAALKDAFQRGASTQAIAAGSGYGGYTWGMGERDMAKNFTRQLRLASGEASISDRVMGAIKSIQRVSEATENVERVNIYNNAIKNGMSHGDAAWKAYQLAPFSRRGTADGIFGSILHSTLPYIPFLNARLQGLYRVVEANPGAARIAGIPKEIFLRSMVITAFSVAAAAYTMNNDPDLWKSLTIDEKMNNHIISNGAGSVTRIPREFEYGTFAGAIPVMIMDYLFGKGVAGKDMAKAFGMAISNTFGFTPIPTIAYPMMSAVTNYDWFRMAPLETRRQQELPVSERVGPNTSSAAKKISAAATSVGEYVKELPLLGSLNQLSPVKAQAILDGYLGTSGTMLLTAFDQIMSSMGVGPKKPSVGTGDPNSVAGIAATVLGFNRFVKERREFADKFVRDYYEMRNDINQIYTSINSARTTNDVARLQEITPKERTMYGMHTMVNNAGKMLSQISKQIEIVTKDPQMSPDEKNKRLTELRKAQSDIARRVTEAGRNAGIM